MRKTIVFLSAIFLLGCVGTAPRQTRQGDYDLGDLTGQWRAPGFPIISVEVRSSSWLSGIAMRYRLSYADPQRQFAYAESRWAAPPAELLERQLRQRIVFGQPDFNAAGCRLRLLLDDFEQRFANAQSSELVLTVSAGLLPRNGETLLAKRNFAIRQPAPSADAQGGVIAARLAVDVLAAELSDWLANQLLERPQSVAPCNSPA